MAILVAALAFGVSSVQTPPQRLDIPSDFMVGNRTYPAGQYEVLHADAIMITWRAKPEPEVTMVKLIFDKIGDKRILSEAWMPGRQAKRWIPAAAARAGPPDPAHFEVELSLGFGAVHEILSGDFAGMQPRIGHLLCVGWGFSEGNILDRLGLVHRSDHLLMARRWYNLNRFDRPRDFKVTAQRFSSRCFRLPPKLAGSNQKGKK